MKIASWNVNSIRARLEHVTTWLKANRPDVLFLQELKSTEFSAAVFTEMGYESAAVTQKGYNGVAVLSLTPIETISTALAGDGDDTHARFLEMTIQGIRMVNIYLPNGNPVGTEKFAYKLAWMERLGKEMSAWLKTDMPVLIGGDFNVIPGLDSPCIRAQSGIIEQNSIANAKLSALLARKQFRFLDCLDDRELRRALRLAVKQINDRRHSG